jgi:hypothetical protein
MRIYKYIVRFEVIAAVTIKNTIFWGVTPCTQVEVHRCFAVKYCIHLQRRRVSKARIQQEVGAK